MGHRAAMLLGLLAVSIAVQHAAAAADCGALLKEYYEFNYHQQLAPAGAQELLYVLRTPNTYARELDTCLIRFGVPGTQRCPSQGEQISDGVFRKLKGCRVLSSTDDLSVLKKLSLGSTAVAAELRDPVERLVEAYELAVEIALQKLDADRAKSPFEAMQKQHPSDVWPWSKFTPFLAKDMAQRAQKVMDEDDEDDDLTSPGNWVELFDKDGQPFFMHTITDEQKEALSEAEQAQLLPALDPYDNKLVMPLKDFVKHPKVLQVLHNGELLQVLGLTNTSKWEKAKDMRTCIRKDAAVADELFSYAAKLLESFAYVGLGDDLNSSAELAAAALGRALDGPAYAHGELFIPGVKKVKVMSFTGGMKPETADSGSAKEVDVEGHDAMTMEEIKAEIEKREEVAKKLYDEAYDLFVKGTASKAEIAAARAKVSAAKAATMQLKYDLEQMEGQKDLDKTLDGTLGTEFHTCVGKIREAATKQANKVANTLVMPDGRQVRFTPEARKQISEETLAEIRRLNALDIKLYEHAKQLVTKRRAELQAAGKLQRLPAPLAVAAAADKAEPAKTAEL